MPQLRAAEHHFCMIHIKKELFAALLHHLEGEYPNEGCGLLSGRNGEVLKVHPIRNIEPSPVSYLMDPKEELEFFRNIREENLELVGIYHSHPTSDPYPSEKDRALAVYEEPFYLIVSLKDRKRPAARAFRLCGGKIEEDKVYRAE